MAKAATVDTSLVECGFCLEKGTSLVDPKLLPCGDVHCLPCLDGAYQVLGIVQCPTCSEVFDVTPESLPPSEPGVDNPKHFCDVCSVKGLGDQPAVSFCVQCHKKYCQEHKQSHNDDFDVHQMFVINEYSHWELKLQPRQCEEHPDHPVVLGCEVCGIALCAQCKDVGVCDTLDTTHKVLPLEDLVDRVMEKVADMKVRARQKLDIFSALSKKGSVVLTEFDGGTESVIDLIHKTRDEQMKAIRERYDVLETVVSEGRKVTRMEMKEFVESVVDGGHRELSKELQRVTATLRDSHQVDVATGHKETCAQLKSSIEDRLPSLRIHDVINVVKKGTFREIELQMTSVDTINIGPSSLSESSAIFRTALPMSMRLMETVKISDDCLSVTSCMGNTYVGVCCITDSYGGVDVIDEHRRLQRRLISIKGRLYGFTAHRDRLYLLYRRRIVRRRRRVLEYAVGVYDLDGNHVSSWTHPDIIDVAHYANQPVVVGDQLVLANISQQKLCVYSLIGEVIRQIRCPWIGREGIISMSTCAMNDETSIILSRETSTVCRININTSELVWMCTIVANSRGVTCHREDFVLIGSGDFSSTISVHLLNGTTGEHLRRISGPVQKIRLSSYISDLLVQDGTLIVSLYAGRAVQFYELE